jgi:hypothetical protein
MISFQISVNQKQVAVIGLPGDGVVSAILHAVKRKESLQLSLDMSALEEDEDGSKRDITWQDVSLSEGDEITVKVLNVEVVDAPSTVKVQDASEIVERKKLYLKHLQSELKDV